MPWGRGTTEMGSKNDHGQEVIRKTDLPGTGLNQKVYALRCAHCGHVYGANGFDVHLRKRPNCQGGAEGLPLK